MIVTNWVKIFIVFTLAQELVSRIYKQLRLSEVAEIHHQAFSARATMTVKRFTVFSGQEKWNQDPPSIALNPWKWQ